MKSQARAKRPYDASRRQEQARATRRAVVDAASRLFVRKGYAGTSADEIAAKAGVCRATVFAVGGKGDLLKLAYDFAVGGDDEEIRLVERPRSREVRAAPDARSYLRGYAGLVTDIYVRLAALHEVVRAASHSDSEVGALWRKINADRPNASSVTRCSSSAGSMTFSRNGCIASDGATAFTRTFAGAASIAAARVSAITPAFAAA